MSDTYTGIVRTYYDMEETKLKEEYFLVNGKNEGIKKHYDTGKIKKYIHI
jgi:antitoxin component YwqK of YwqJK toxin-antitoxin module